ncbi:MAG: hypothetical protein IMW97_00695 [Firmicutes bacterium]|nr:hypothetical protein [Candidatus Fermentithermobacillaceae bacterium]
MLRRLVAVLLLLYQERASAAEYIRYFHSGGGPARWTRKQVVFYDDKDYEVHFEAQKTLSRRVFAQSNVVVDSHFDVMVAKVGISAEVSLGTETTETWTVGIDAMVPPHSSLTVEWGSEGARGYGKEVYYLNNVPTDEWPVSGSWTSRDYVRVF